MKEATTNDINKLLTKGERISKDIDNSTPASRLLKVILQDASLPETVRSLKNSDLSSLLINDNGQFNTLDTDAVAQSSQEEQTLTLDNERLYGNF